MKLDSVDVSILKVLLQDGRASLRSVARKTSSTTPTVSYHLSRMIRSGLIQKFVPVFDPTIAASRVNAFVAIKTKASTIEAVSQRLSSMEEVSGVFMTTGENNIMLRVSCADAKSLKALLSVKLPNSVDCEVISSQIIVDTAKDERPVALTGDISLKLRCDLCKGEVNGDRPYYVRVGSTRHYFCCRTCRREFLEKYGKRIQRINAPRRTA